MLEKVDFGCVGWVFISLLLVEKIGGKLPFLFIEALGWSAFELVWQARLKPKDGITEGKG